VASPFLFDFISVGVRSGTTGRGLYFFLVVYHLFISSCSSHGERVVARRARIFFC